LAHPHVLAAEGGTQWIDGSNITDPSESVCGGLANIPVVVLFQDDNEWLDSPGISELAQHPDYRLTELERFGVL
jgi:hypothetical protein